MTEQDSESSILLTPNPLLPTKNFAQELAPHDRQQNNKTKKHQLAG